MSSSSVEKIKERLGIVDVISSYLKIEKAGGNYKAPCPFHNEKTPSFFISPLRGSYYCFGCGAKGDIFTFVEQFEGLDFKGALNVLALRAGVELTPYNPNEKTSEKDRLYTIMEAATLFYESQLLENTEAQAYVQNRGITEETRKKFRIGYAPHPDTAGWRALTTEMRSRGFSDEELISAGLAKAPEENKQGDLYDRFRDRIMFPISDTGGRVIAFSGRILHDDGTAMGKYINSPETPIFKKGSTLYGLDKAKFEIRRRDVAILVEGQMDLVLSHQAGFSNTIASSGTALSDALMADGEKGLLSGLGQVHGLTKNLIVAFDADKAGLRAAGKAERIGLSLGMNVKVAKLPAGKDPADIIRSEGADGWKKIIASAEHIILCYLSVLFEHPLSEHTRMRAIRDKILPYIAVMPSAIERAHFIREIHARTGIPEEALAEDVERLSVVEQKSSFAPVAPSAVPSVGRSTRIEDRLFGILVWQESVAEPAIDVASLKLALEKIIGSEQYHIFYQTTQDKKSERIFEVEVMYDNHSRLEREVQELLQNLEEESLGQQLESCMQELSQAEVTHDAEKIQTILSRSQAITSRLNEIKTNRHLHT